MKIIAHAIATILWIAFLIGLHFLFGGYPSVWDKLHDLAMGMCS